MPIEFPPNLQAFATIVRARAATAGHRWPGREEPSRTKPEMVCDCAKRPRRRALQSTDEAEGLRYGWGCAETVRRWDAVGAEESAARHASASALGCCGRATNDQLRSDDQFLRGLLGFFDGADGLTDG